MTSPWRASEGAVRKNRPLVLDRRQRRRGRRRRDRGHAVGHRDVVDHRGRHARAVRAHDGDDVVGGDEALRRGDGGGGVDAGRVAAHRRDRAPAEQQPGLRGLREGELGGVRHVGHDRLERPREAEDDADGNRVVLGQGRGRDQRGGGRSQHELLHVRSPKRLFSPAGARRFPVARAGSVLVLMQGFARRYGATTPPRRFFGSPDDRERRPRPPGAPKSTRAPNPG